MQEIDWQSLTHAYGEASTLPDLIKSLASPMPEIWQQALDELYDTILHQETLYEATSFVVPFLIALLENNVVQCKGEILYFLANLADISLSFATPTSAKEREEQQEEVLWLNASPLRRQNFLEQKQQYQLWSEKTYQALSQGRETYLKCLESEDSRVRIYALYTLDALQQYSDEITLSLVDGLFQETDPQLKASFLIYLGHQEKYFLKNKNCLKEWIERREEHLLVKVIATLIQVRFMQERTPFETVDMLRGALLPTPEIEQMYAELPWSRTSGRSLVSEICVALLALGFDRSDLLIPKLLAALTQMDQVYQSRGSRHISDLAVLDIARTLIHFSFQGKGLNINEIPFMLNNTQRTVLTSLLQSQLLLDFTSDLAEIMESFGFPSPWKVRLLLGLIP